MLNSSHIAKEDVILRPETTPSMQPLILLLARLSHSFSPGNPWLCEDSGTGLMH